MADDCKPTARLGVGLDLFRVKPLSRAAFPFSCDGDSFDVAMGEGKAVREGGTPFVGPSSKLKLLGDFLTSVRL